MLFPTPNQQCQSTEGLTNNVTPTRLEIHCRRRTITRPTVHTDMTVHCHLMDSAYCMVTQCHSLRLAELRRYDGKCTFSLSLSSSSSCWNIGRRAFSISVCRWQICLHPYTSIGELPSILCQGVPEWLLLVVSVAVLFSQRWG